MVRVVLISKPILILRKLTIFKIQFSSKSCFMSDTFCDFFFPPSSFQALEIRTYRHWASVSTFERWPSVTSSCHTFFCWESQPWCNCSSKGRYFIVATVLSSRIFTHLKPLKFSEDTFNKCLEVCWFRIYHSWFRDNNNSATGIWGHVQALCISTLGIQQGASL